MGAKKFSHTHRLTMCGLKKLGAGFFPESWKVLAEWRRKRTKNNKSPCYPGWLNCSSTFLLVMQLPLLNYSKNVDTETKRLPWWLPQSSLKTLNASFNFLSEDQGRHPEDHFIPVKVWLIIRWYPAKKGPTRHAYAWQIGPFWQDTLDMTVKQTRHVTGLHSQQRLKCHPVTPVQCISWWK